MANNDYLKVVYLILAYLSNQFKKNVFKVSLDDITRNVKFPKKTTEEYVIQCLLNLEEEGYVKLYKDDEVYLDDSFDFEIKAIKITHKGFEYLEENKTMKSITKYILENGIDKFIAAASLFI